jgi:P-type Ca2+ transporter type 2C
MKLSYPLSNVHAMTADAVLLSLGTDTKQGLHLEEAAKRIAAFGPNTYISQHKKPAWLLFLYQVKSPIVYLLLAGIVVSLLYRDFIDAIAIAAVIVINALIGFFMEMQARSSMKALKQMDIILCRAMRGGKRVHLPSADLTPGDIMLLEAGDIVPADGRLLHANQLQCDESSLTGESIPTMKDIAVLPAATVAGDRLNMVFKGSAVMNGKGTAVVTGIAGETELGAISSMVDHTATTITPLDKKINALSKRLIWITLLMTAIFVIAGIVQGKPFFSIIETAIALAVAAIPEGLPIVCTIALAYGVLLMAKRNAIVKKLSAVETLGSTNVILTDKTGTLTENRISIACFGFPGETLQVRLADGKLVVNSGSMEKNRINFEQLRLTGALCNNAHTIHREGKDVLLGDPVEIALMELANTDGCTAASFLQHYPRLAEQPFSAETKMMATLHKSPHGYLVAAKGSVEQLLEKCSWLASGADKKPMEGAERAAIIAAAGDLSQTGLRVLAFAYREAGEIDQAHYLQELVFTGLTGFLDPPRMDIRPAILLCRKAGIRVVMITGDHPLTALAIAREIGLIDKNDQQAIAGKDIPLPAMMTDAWRNKILNTAVFARTNPRQKLEIAGIYQQAGNIVAMTGDGVNDAPALKKADVGIAMGIRGTQVAKETASIVLKDDSFTSIAAAVAYGRTIFQNIQKFVLYLVSCNLSEILIVTLLGIVLPAAALFPLQILFLNMVTDIFPALALGVGKKDDAVMERPPRSPSKDIITGKDWVSIAVYAILISASVVLAVFFCRHYISSDPTTINNIAFITLAFAQLFHVFNMSAPASAFINNEITRNRFVWLAILVCTGCMALVFLVPSLRLVLHLTVLPISVWETGLLAAALPLVWVQLYKRIFMRRKINITQANII